MQLLFLAPDHSLQLPGSQGAGMAVTSYDVAIVLSNGGIPSQPLETISVPRSAVTMTAGEASCAIALGAPSRNQDVKAFVRAVNAQQGVVGPWGDPTASFYGGFPLLTKCNGVSVE